MPCFLSRCARQVVPMWFYFINGISTSNFKYNPQSLIIYLSEILLFLIQLLSLIHIWIPYDASQKFKGKNGEDIGIPESPSYLKFYAD